MSKKKKNYTHVVVTYPEFGEAAVCRSEAEAIEVARVMGSNVRIYSLKEEFKVKIELEKVK